MSKTITLTPKRLADLLEVAIAKTKAEQAAEAPDYIVQNSHVYITNNYGDSYEPETTPVSQAAVDPSTQTKSSLAIRKGISNLFIRAEQKARELDETNPNGALVSAKSAVAALVERFEDLQLRLKGDTSLELVQNAYVMMALQLCLAADLSQIFEGMDG